MKSIYYLLIVVLMCCSFVDMTQGAFNPPGDLPALEDLVRMETKAAVIEKNSMDAIHFGIAWYDNNGNMVSAHGAGIIKECDLYYFLVNSRTTRTMPSKDLAAIRHRIFTTGPLKI